MRKEVFKISLTILLSTLIVFIPTAYAEKIKTIAIFPFKINAAQDLTFLKEGIMDMLSSRLYWKDKVIVVENELIKKKVAEFKGSLNKETALKIGKALKVDYVILGSLTVFGNSVSMDAKILDVAQERELITAFTQSKTMDEVIPTVNTFAQDINAKIMGKYVRPPIYVKAPEEKIGSKELIRAEEGFQDKEMGHVQDFGTDIIGLDVGDIDGDGRNELVFIDRDTVYIYKWMDRKFTEFRAIKGRWFPNYVYLSVADLDGNGRAEIYVSNLTESDISSFALEWRSGGFPTISVHQRWFFRVIDLPEKGKTLIGQGRIRGGGFSRYAYILKRDGDNFAKGERLRLPAKANVFNFIQGNIADKNTVQTLVLSPETEYLLLFDEDGQEIWRSEDKFGGTDTHMVVPESSRGNEEERWIHFAPPVFLSDIDDDGLQEVAICKNRSSVGRLLSKVKMFSSGKLHFLAWNRVALATKWETKKMPGPITGYCLKDVDNDGNNELVMAVVLRSKSISGRSGRSQVVIYDLD